MYLIHYRNNSSIFFCIRHENDFTYETFSAFLIRDLDLPECFYTPIADSIRTQVEQAKRYLPWFDADKDESLHPISIKLRINDTIVLDRFEWDLSNPRNDPDHFARTFCAEMVNMIILFKPKFI